MGFEKSAFCFEACMWVHCLVFTIAFYSYIFAIGKRQQIWSSFSNLN